LETRYPFGTFLFLVLSAQEQTKFPAPGVSLFFCPVREHFLSGLARPTSNLETCQNARGSERLHMFAATFHREIRQTFDKIMENPYVFAILEFWRLARVGFQGISTTSMLEQA